jgi:hypothetical protein
MNPTLTASPSSFSEVVSSFRSQKLGSLYLHQHLDPSPEELLGYVARSGSSTVTYIPCVLLSETRTTVTVLCVTHPLPASTHLYRATFQKDYRGYGKAADRVYLSIEESKQSAIGRRRVDQNARGRVPFPIGGLEERGTGDSWRSSRLYLDKEGVDAYRDQLKADEEDRREKETILSALTRKAEEVSRLRSRLTHEQLAEVKSLTASLSSLIENASRR